MNTIPHPTRCPHCHTITPGLPYLTKCPTCRHYTPATWRRRAHLTLFGAVVTLTVGAIVVSTDSTSDRGSVAEILRQADKDAVTRKHQEELTSCVTTEL